MSVNRRLSGALLALLGPLTVVGCQPATTCPENGAPCGGDPTGAWTVVDACRDPVFAAPLQPTYQGQPVEMARQPNPVMTSSDWCSSLIVGPSGVSSFTFPHDTLSPSGGQITYAADGTYQATIDTTGPGAVDLSVACLTRAGSSTSCDTVAASLTAFAAVKPAQPGQPCTDSPSEPAGCQYYFSYENIACAPSGPSADAGCHCAYTVSFAGALAGRWSHTGSVLTHFDASKMLPSQADYCVDATNGRLSLWGHDQTSLFDQTGIRTLELQRMP